MTLVNNRLTVLSLEVVEGPYVERHDQDGSPYVTLDGYRIEARVEGDTDHIYTQDMRYEYRAEAGHAMEFIQRVGTINPERWYGRTIYGSRSWVTEGCEAMEIAREREETYGY